ncbi:MAG: porin [Alphaproteobacteria bacterium]|nr:porin [Alphaproteobacteria bacterium]
MRKFLLAGAATVAMTGAAGAAGLEPSQPSNTHNIMLRAEPGKVIVRLDGYVFAAIGVGSNTNDKATTGSGPVAAPTIPGRTSKVDPIGILTQFRFFPSFDAQTTGGLRYGALAEIRSNNNTGNAGTGVGTAGQRTTNTLYVNRTRGYVGGDSWGTFLIGSTDGPAATLRTGLIEAQVADGGWNGWAPGLTRGVNPYQFAIGGGYEYSAQKIIYLTPTFSGFRAGVSFTPSTASNQSGEGINTGLEGGTRTSVVNSAFTAGAGDFNRFRNQIQVAANYSNTFGGVGVAAHVGYITSGAIKSSNPTGVAGPTSARGQSIFAAGLQGSYAGFTLGGYMNTGTFNGNSSLTIAGLKPSTVWTIGAAYETGPWAVGAHYMAASTNGNLTNNNQRFDTGVGFGVTYAWAPGMRAMLEGVVGSAKERGRNLSNDATLAAGTTKGINASAVILANQFRW